MPSLFWPELHLHIDRLGRLQLFLSPQAVGWTNSAVIGGVCWLHLGQPAGGEGHTGTKLGGGAPPEGDPDPAKGKYNFLTKLKNPSFDEGEKGFTAGKSRRGHSRELQLAGETEERWQQDFFKRKFFLMDLKPV